MSVSAEVEAENQEISGTEVEAENQEVSVTQTAPPTFTPPAPDRPVGVSPTL